MKCLNLNIPQVKKDFDELTNVFKSEKIAYALLATNNGYNLDLTPEGNSSKLFSELLVEYDEDRNKALVQKAQIYTPKYLKSNNWIESGQEPSSKELITIKEIKETLPVKSYKFLQNRNIPSIDKVYNNSLYSSSDTSKWKDLSRVRSLLVDSSQDFEDNGLFLYRGDPYIVSLNANLMEELLDEKSFIQRINERHIKEQREVGIPTHKTITSKLFEGTYWVISTDDSYTQDMPYDEQQLRRKNILSRNEKKIDEVNKYFESILGRSAIYTTKINDKGLSKIKVVFNKEVLNQYNSLQYTNYLNSLTKYFEQDNPNVEQDFTLIPLSKRLKKEQSSLRTEKARLELSGGKVAEINKIDNKITEIKERISKLDAEATLNDIYNEAEKQFIEVDEMLKKKKLSPTDIRKALTNMEIWLSAGDFSTNDHPFLDEEMIQSKIIKDKFRELKVKAESRVNEVLNKGKNVLTNIVNTNIHTPDNKALTYNQILELVHKYGGWNKNTLSLNRVGHALAQFIFKTVNEANDAAFRETKTHSRYLADLFYEVKNSGFDDRLFYQMETLNTSKGPKQVPTGYLVNKFSKSWFFLDKNKVSNRNNNILTLNPYLLFEVEGEEHDKHIQEIIDNLGTIGAEKFIEKARKKYEEYLKVRDAHIAIEYGLKDNFPVDSIITFETKRTQLINAVRNNQEIWIKYRSKRQQDNGEEATWRHITVGALNQDSTQLTDVEGSSDLKTFNIDLNYRFLDISLTGPTEIVVEGSLTPEQIAELELWEKQNSPIERIKAINRTNKEKANEVTGKDSFLVMVPLKVNKANQVTDFYDTNFDTIESNPIAYKFYNEAEEITNNASNIFGRGDFSMNSLAFIERSLISKLSKNGVANFLTKDLYNNIIESFVGGTPTKNSIDPITGKPVKELKKSAVSIDSLIKDKLAKLIERNTEELTEQRYNDLYAQSIEEVFNETKFDRGNTSLFQSLNILNMAALSYKHSSMIEDTINLALTYLPNSTMSTGDDIVDEKGNVVGERYIQNLQESIEYFLDVSYYKSPKGDTSGYLGNLRNKEERKEAKVLKDILVNPEASKEDKQEAKDKLQKLGTRVTVNSLTRRLMDFLRLKALGWNFGAAFVNLTFGTLTNMYAAFDGRLFNRKEWLIAEKESYTNLSKLNKVIENYHIIGDILYEFEEKNKFQEKASWLFKLTKALKPYAMQTATEKKNQGTVMIAMMLHQQVTNTKTNETKPLWEAIDSNGKLTDEWSIGNKSGYEAIQDMTGKIKSSIQEIHGDYNNPLMIKKTLAGMAVSMFRLWFFEAIHSRIGSEKPDYLRGIVTKGRYRTMFQLAKHFKLNPMALYKAYKNNELSKVDAANVRSSIAELVTMSLTTLVAFMLKEGICGDDESKKCKNSNGAQLTSLNLVQRLTEDVNFYRSPSAWKRFITNPTALTSLLDDVAKVYELTGYSLSGDEEALHYRSGYFKDRNKWEVFIKTRTPFINQFERLEKYGSELMSL